MKRQKGSVWGGGEGGRLSDSFLVQTEVAHNESLAQILSV